MVKHLLGQGEFHPSPMTIILLLGALTLRLETLTCTTTFIEFRAPSPMYLTCLLLLHFNEEGSEEIFEGFACVCSGVVML